MSLDADLVARVTAGLVARGASEEEVDAAVAENRIELLVLDRLALPGPLKYSAAEIAATAALPTELTDRLWRALGFTSPPPDEPAFGDADAEALATLRRLMEVGVAAESSVQFARVVGAAMARVADAEVSAHPVQRPTTEEQLAFAAAILAGGDEFFRNMTELLGYVYRRHLQAAVRRAMTTGHPEAGVEVVTVGFADLVGYTALSSQLSEEALGHLVSRFEELARDAVTEGGGRVVKMIGDEVMFVVDDAARAARIALTLADVFADDEVLSDVRVGLATGNVLSQEGDYYGTVVNLASRLVNVAYPGTVVVSEDIHGALTGDPGLAWRSLRVRHLKDIGNVPLYVMYRAGDEPRSSRRRFRPLRTLLSEAGFQRAEHDGR